MLSWAEWVAYSLNIKTFLNICYRLSVLVKIRTDKILEIAFGGKDQFIRIF